MVKFFKKVSNKAGLVPGAPVFVGEKKVEEVSMTIIDYDKDTFEVKVSDKVEDCLPYKDKPTITWINISGLHEVSVVEKLGNCFGLHPLVIEDILNTEQQPKMDVFDDHIFIVIKIHLYNSEIRQVISEQVSVIFGKNFVLTFQEKEGDVFEPVRNRLKHNKGRIRKEGADYLMHALIDGVVDNYFKVLEGIGEEIEDMEEELITNPVPETLQKIHGLKREMIMLRKSVWPLREIISGLAREETSLIKKTTKIYIRDLYDHTIQVIDTVETYRDIISGMLDVYLSSISNRMNEIMKVLTIFAVLFIPLTFIAGIYGMNFNPEKSPLNMPELNWYFGYPLAIGLMVSTGIVMLIYFKRKKWI
jgi:magnesium transporter